MNRQVVAPKTVLEAILEWSTDRPLWQRDALRTFRPTLQAMQP